MAFASSTSAPDNRSTVHHLQLPNLPPLGFTDPLFLYGGWALLVAGGIFGIVFWRSKLQRRRRSTIPRSPTVDHPPSSPPVLEGIDLKLLWFMSDEKAEALPAEIERFIAAFERDLQLTHTAVSARGSREIHRSAHRLVAHSAAINYEPLHRLATQLQAEASTLPPHQLDKLIAEFDLRFAELKRTLGEIRLSSERA